MPTLDLLPSNPHLSFQEEDHKYIYRHQVLGDLHVDSVSQVMASTGAKCMNYSAWRQSLVRGGTCKTEIEADQYMESHRKHRASVGTHFHALAYGELTGNRIADVHDESRDMLHRWREQFLPAIDTVKIAEMPMVHPACFYAGTPDLFCSLKEGPLATGQPILCDYKTQQAGKEKVRSEWPMQLGAYAELIRANYGIHVRHGLMLIITTEGVRQQYYNYADLKQGWRRFAGFLAEHHARKAVMGSLPNQLALQAMEPMFA